MPRKSAQKPKPIFSRPEVVGLCKRFLKEGQYSAAQSPMFMYKLLKQFPNRDFWFNYNLGFQLNSLAWFLGKDGQERLSRDWKIFHLDLGSQVRHIVSDHKIGEDADIQSKPRTVADLLR